MEEVLAHRFLNPAAAAPISLPMRYFGFLSHAQVDASSTVATLYLLYKQFGLHTWVDMRQEVLTLEGMRQGVRDSSVFTLILTEHVLGSWFCKQEILCAIEEEKPFQLIIEAEPRFSPFDLGAWQASAGQARRMFGADAALTVSLDDKVAWQASLGNDALADRIAQ